MSQIYIEIKSVPLVRDPDKMISPAASLVARCCEKSQTVELRLLRNGGKLHCYLGVDSIMGAKQAKLILQDMRCGMAAPAAIASSVQTSALVLRDVSEYMDLNTNQIANQRYLNAREISAADMRLRELYYSLSKMEDGCGYALFFRRLGKLDLQSAANIRKGCPMNDQLSGMLCTQTEVFEFCGCVLGTAEQTAFLKQELQYACPGLCTNEISVMFLDSASVWKQVDQIRGKSSHPGALVMRKTILRPELEVLTDLSRIPQVNGVAINKDTLFPLQQGDLEQSDDVLHMGLSADGTSQTMPVTALRRHMFISGAPGTGKGNLVFSLAEQLHKKKIPMLLIESAKQEQHHLRKALPDLKVWRPNGGEYLLNPFSLPPNVTMGDYRASLLQMMRVCFRLDGVLEELFSTTLTQCFAKYGYTESSVLSDGRCIPFGLSEFMSEYSRLVATQGYAGEVKSNLRSAGITRLRALFDQNPNVFDTVHSIPVSELTQGENLLQLNGLITLESKQLFATILLISLGAWLRLNAKHQSGLRLVVIMDESHNLLSGVQNINGEEYSFSKDFLNLLLEMRSVGVGFVVADQSADNLPAMISQVCATKVFLGSSRFSGIEQYADMLRADETTLNNLFLLKAGEGIWHTTGMSSGSFIRMEHVMKKYRLEEDYPTANSYLEKNPSFMLQTFRECRSCGTKDRCSRSTKDTARQTASSLVQIHKIKINQALQEIYAASMNKFSDKQEAEQMRKKAEKYADGVLYNVVTAVEKLRGINGECVLQQFARQYCRECECKFDPYGMVLSYVDSICSRLLHIWRKQNS